MLKFAIVGLGVMGKNHFRALQNVSGVRLACMCDPCISDADVAVLCEPFKERNLAPKFYRDLDEMLANESLDAVIIATPTSLHKDAALKCMQKGVNLLIEKPVASNAADAQILLDEAQRINLKVAIGHIERFNPSVVALKNELANEEIFSIRITRNAPFPQRIADVGILTDLAVHDIDLIRYLSQKEIKNMSVMSSKKLHAKFEDNANLSFLLEGEILASINTSWLAPKRERKIEVACKGAYFEADLLAQTLVKFTEFDANSYRTQNCFVKRTDALTSELESFARLLNGVEQEGATIKDSLKTLKIIERAS